MKPDDLVARMYYIFGIRHDTEVRDVANRPVPISYNWGIEEVIA